MATEATPVVPEDTEQTELEVTGSPGSANSSSGSETYVEKTGNHKTAQDTSTIPEQSKLQHDPSKEIALRPTVAEDDASESRNIKVTEVNKIKEDANDTKPKRTVSLIDGVVSGHNGVMTERKDTMDASVDTKPKDKDGNEATTKSGTDIATEDKHEVITTGDKEQNVRNEDNVAGPSTTQHYTPSKNVTDVSDDDKGKGKGPATKSIFGGDAALSKMNRFDNPTLGRFLSPITTRPLISAKGDDQRHNTRADNPDVQDNVKTNTNIDRQIHELDGTSKSTTAQLIGGPSRVGTDTGTQDANTSFSQDSGDGEEVSVTMYQVTDINGDPATEDTPFENFRTWAAYILYCEQREQATLRFGTTINGHFTPSAILRVPRKLLVDNSQYFRSALTSPMFTESAGSTVNFEADPDIPHVNPENFIRLIGYLRSGCGLDQPGNEKEFHMVAAATSFQEAVAAYTLADFLVMDRARHALACSIRAGLAVLRARWPAKLAVEIGPDSPCGPASLEDVHAHEFVARDLLLGLDAMRRLPEGSRLVDVEDWIPVLVGVCPRELLDAVWDTVSLETREAIGQAALFSPRWD